MKIRILGSAFQDLEQGWVFYERQSPGVGDYFHECLFNDIDSLARYGGIHRMVYGFHRLLSKRFPHAIYYRIDEQGQAVVYRVLDCRRDPARIRRELGRPPTDVTKEE
jgi:plasmid stabilization system protein ParE